MGKRLQDVDDECNLMIGNHEPTSLISITSYLVTKEYHDPQLISILMTDICEQNISLRLKRIILQQAICETPDVAPKIALSIALCVSHILLTPDQDNDEHKGLLSDKTTTTIGKIKRELLPMDTKLLLDILQEIRNSIPIELVEEWTFMWQVILFPYEKATYLKCRNHPFIIDFIQRKKEILSITEENDKPLSDRSQSSSSSALQNQSFDFESHTLTLNLPYVL